MATRLKVSLEVFFYKENWGIEDNEQFKSAVDVVMKRDVLPRLDYFVEYKLGEIEETECNS